MWLLFALAGPVLWAASTHIDKYLVERYFRDSDTAVLMVFTALTGILLLPPIAYYEAGVFHTPARDISVMIASGACYMAAMLFYLRAIQSEEASVVAPLFQTSTLFTYLFAYVFLGEVLTATEIGGAVLIVAGALLISLDISARARGLKLRLVATMLACTGTLAMASVIFKFFAVRERFWVTTFWTSVGDVLFGLGIVAIPAYRRQLVELLRRSAGPMLAINGANELINLGGGLGVRYALLMAPVAVVSAVSSTTTLFVFLFGILLTRFFPMLGREDLSWRNLAQKAAAAVLIAIGVALIDQPDA